MLPIPRILFATICLNYAFSQNIKVQHDEWFEKVKKDSFEIYVDVINEQSLIIQRNKDKEVQLIGYYRRSDVDSICTELTYPPFFTSAAYFEFKNGKITRFISEKTDEYFVIIDEDGDEQVYMFYRGQDDIFGLVFYARDNEVTKIVLANPEKNWRRSEK